MQLDRKLEYYDKSFLKNVYCQFIFLSVVQRLTTSISTISGTFTSQSDVWAFAVTVWEIFMFVSEQPYEDLSDQLVIENACSFIQDKSKAFRYLQKPPGCPDDVYSMLLMCWQKAPDTRPNFDDLLEFYKSMTKASTEVEI